MMTLLLACVLATLPHAKMHDDFLGEPQTIGDMRVGDTFSLPAHCLTVDLEGKCWLERTQKLDEKSDHMLSVSRKKVKGKVVYTVYLDKTSLKGWRWKKQDVPTPYYEEKGKRIPLNNRFIPVAYLSANFIERF